MNAMGEEWSEQAHVGRCAGHDRSCYSVNRKISDKVRQQATIHDGHLRSNLKPENQSFRLARLTKDARRRTIFFAAHALN